MVKHKVSRIQLESLSVKPLSLTTRNLLATPADRLSNPMSTNQKNQRHALSSSPAWRIPLNLLGYRDFRFVWAAGAIHWTVRWFEALATAIFVFQLTGSPLYVTLIFVARYSSLALFGSLAGGLSERFNRRLMLLVGYAVLVFVYAVLALLVLSEQIQLWHIFLGTFLNGMGMALEFPVRRTMLGDLAGFQRIGSAMNLDQATRKVTDMIGPLIGGLVFQFIGILGVYLLAAFLLFVATLLIFSLSFNFNPIQKQKVTLLLGLLQGFNYAHSHPVIFAVLSVTIVLNVFGYHALTAMVPVIGIEVLSLNPFLIGIFLATTGLGGVLASTWISLFAQTSHYRRLFLYGTLLFFFTTFLFSCSSNFWISFLLLLAGGVGLGFFGGMQSTILMTEATPALRNRVMGLLTVSIGATPLGILLMGILAEWLGATQALAVSEGIGILFVGLSFLLWPQMRRP